MVLSLPCMVAKWLQRSRRSVLARSTYQKEGIRDSLVISVSFIFFIFYLFFKDFIYLFMRERERGRDTGRGRSRLHAGSLMWDLILGIQDHALG